MGYLVVEFKTFYTTFDRKIKISYLCTTLIRFLIVNLEIHLLIINYDKIYILFYTR